MWDAGEDWGDLLRGSHRTYATITVTLGGDRLATISDDPDVLDDPAVHRLTHWKISAQVRGSLTESQLEFSVADETGELLTDHPDSPLQTFGQRVMLQTTVVAGDVRETVPMGIWRIGSAIPSGGQWRLYPNGAWVRPSQIITVTAHDLLELTAEHDFLGPSIPPAGATTHTEIRRLIDGDMPVALTGGSRPVGRTPWEHSRIDAVASLFTDMGKVAWVDRSGVLRDRTAQVDPSGGLRIMAATPGGLLHGHGLVSWRPEARREGLYNGVAMSGQRGDGERLHGSAYITTGPMAWSASGFGRVTYAAHSPLLTTQAQVSQAATTRLTNLQAGRGRELRVEIIPNPALDLLDTISVVVPDTGREIPALVTALTIGSAGAMTVDGTVPWEVGIHG